MPVGVEVGEVVKDVEVYLPVLSLYGEESLGEVSFPFVSVEIQLVHFHLNPKNLNRGIVAYGKCR